MQQQTGYPPEVMAQIMTPDAYQAHVAWPEGMPDAFGGGGFYGAGSDDGDNLMEDSDRDDPERVPSATGGSDDDDMHD